MLPWILSIPWLALWLYLGLRLRRPYELPREGVGSGAPFVSVIVPARNEERNIEACVSSLERSSYPRFEIIVVDDRSTDRTAEVARVAERGRAERRLVIEGAELPEGWLGKPWACTQGAREARGELLLFTDADTTHDRELLERSVRALQEDEADAVTLFGRQLMESFWERLLQPQIFLAMAIRFPDQRRPVPRKRWRDAIANGQFLLFTRSAYERLGGHEAVQAEVVEDLRLAQLLVEGGQRLVVRGAEDVFNTRMYQSLGEIVDGWSKNLAIGGRQTIPPKLRLFVLPVSLVTAITLWLVPPAVALLGLLGLVPAPLSSWGYTLTTLCVVFWSLITWGLHAPFWYGVLYPIGSLVSFYIFARSWMRGGRVMWKGREYRVADS